MLQLGHCMSQVPQTAGVPTKYEDSYDSFGPNFMFYGCSSSMRLSRLEAHLLQLLRVAEVEMASVDGHWPQEILAGAWQGCAGGCLVLSGVRV